MRVKGRGLDGLVRTRIGMAHAHCDVMLGGLHDKMRTESSDVTLRVDCRIRRTFSNHLAVCTVCDNDGHLGFALQS